MDKYEFSKIEIATYLRDYYRTIIYSIKYRDIPFYEVFIHSLVEEDRLQYAMIDYYYEMISIYEFMLFSKYFSVLYDSRFDFLNENQINSINIPRNIFINEDDYSKFSKRQIIQYIRNAFNHNDNISHDLIKFIRVNENDQEIIKVEINLKNSKPIPFHVILDNEAFISIISELQNAKTISIISNQADERVNVHSSNILNALDKMYVRKFYTKKKLSDENLTSIKKIVREKGKTKGLESILSTYGLDYKDYRFLVPQKLKIEEDLKYWEKIKRDSSGALFHLISKVMPISVVKLRTLLTNLILADNYLRSSNRSFTDFSNDAIKMYKSKKLDSSSPVFIYAQLYGIDENIIYDFNDYDDIFSIVSTIYYGFLFDSLISDNDIEFPKSKKIERSHLRDSFVHMRWFKGINECFKLYDWKYGINNEFNPNADGFWKSNVTFADMYNCSETYYKRELAKTSKTINIPIHFRKLKDYLCISFIKDDVYYNLVVSSSNEKKLECNLEIRDRSQIIRSANNDEIRMFISELEYLSSNEKNENKEILDSIVNILSQQCKSEDSIKS